MDDDDYYTLCLGDDNFLFHFSVCFICYCVYDIAERNGMAAHSTPVKRKQMYDMMRSY